MKRHLHFRSFVILCSVLFLGAVQAAMAEPSSTAVSAFDSYVLSVELRLARQHLSQNAFLVPAQDEVRLHQGEIVIEKLTPPVGLPGALLHHWRGTAFVPGAKAADFDRLMKDLPSYPKYFSPQVLQAAILTGQGNHLQASMRVRQKHVITVVMDTAYDITFAQPDPHRGYSLSRSTHISEIDSSGTKAEHALSPDQEHGFLWRQNTYWSYEEQDGGLYLQIESISLSRSIPRGLGWAVQPFVASVPRESLEFTLRSTCKALRKN